MTETAGNTLTKKQRKDKIRERYKGVDPDILEVIPAKKKADFYDDVPRRVAVYVRVSTDDPRQTSSYELQKNYYEDIVQRHESWTLVEIYADEGISGTQLKHRDSFNRMIRDCKSGKIDMILTKSVSRFARNIVDCISIVRELGSLNPPVGVFFETEHIFTLKDDSEMGLSFQATMAQEESHIKSNIMNTSIEMRFSHGIVLTPVLLGYNHDEDGELIINEEEAKTVQLIFFLYLLGHTCTQIADKLTSLKCRTKKGNTSWSTASVYQILRNERYCGEVLTRKTYTPSYLDHKSKKNRGNRTQHRWKDHHEAIISRDDFIAVQHMLNSSGRGRQGFLPELHVVTDGALKGFVLVHPLWAAFSADDYLTASDSVYKDNIYTPPSLPEIHADTGDFDLRGFEIARAQFFSTSGKICLSMSSKTVTFSSQCLRKLDNVHYIEMLIHPREMLLAVRKSDKENRNSLKWARMDSKGCCTPRRFDGKAYLETLFSILGWNTEYKYRICGIRHQKNDESILLFNLRETEIFVPESELNRQMPDKTGDLLEQLSPLIPAVKNTLVAYPDIWANNFGQEYYAQAMKSPLAGKEEKWHSSKTVTYAVEELHITPQETMHAAIKDIINTKSQENMTNGSDHPIDGSKQPGYR